MHRIPLALLLLSPALSLAAANPPAKGPVATEPAEAGPDFLVQGEYVTTATPVFGAQVVAQGGGTFIAVLLPGGLPGAGWDGSKPVSLTGTTSGESTAFTGTGWQGTLRGGSLTMTGPDQLTVTLSRTERRSPTLGLAAPAGAEVVFDGTGTTGLSQGETDKRGLLAALIPGSPGVAPGPISKAAFIDATIHLEFSIPFMPTHRGQSRGNSGVYLQNRYELQVLDSFGMRHGDPRSTGDVCGEIYKVALPKVNLCLPPLSWQTYDIEFIAARWDANGKTEPAYVTLRHNGVLIHDHVAVPKPTGGGKPESRDPGPLMLQHHACPVFYRNVWILKK